MIQIKDGVRFKRFTPEILAVINVLVNVWREFAPGVDPTITSANDSTHMANSYHYSDYALDVRSHDLTMEQKNNILSEMRKRFARLNYDFIIESAMTPNEHFHFEFNERQVKK